MKGILKIYHPAETLKYHIKNTYCKALYSNMQYFLEMEITTDESLDHVEDDSLQYNFPQLSLSIRDYLLTEEELADKSFQIQDSEEDQYTQVDVFHDEEAYLSDNKLSFQKNPDDQLQAIWQGKINDFYTGSNQPIAFKLKCHFKEDPIVIDQD